MTPGELCFVLFYFVLSFYTISSLIYFAKDFFTRFSVIFHITLYTNMIISHYLLLTLRRKPGNLEKSSVQIQTESNQLEISNTCRITKDDSTNLTIAESELSITQSTQMQEELSVLYSELSQYCKICDLTIVKYYIYKAIKR